MSERPSQSSNVELIEELHRRQAVMYAGGPFEPVLELLARDILWHVPGSSPIAGDHRGVDAVVGYFQRRRELARCTMRMRPGEVIAGEDVVVQLVDGSLNDATETLRWRTVGVYRIREQRVSEVWLVPVELDLFDRIWTPQDTTPPSVAG